MNATPLRERRSACLKGRPDQQRVRIRLESHVPEVANYRVGGEQDDAAAADRAHGDPGGAGEEREVPLADGAADFLEPGGEMGDRLERLIGLDGGALGVEDEEPVCVPVDAGTEGERVCGIEDGREDGARDLFLPAFDFALGPAAEGAVDPGVLAVAGQQRGPRSFEGGRRLRSRGRSPPV